MQKMSRIENSLKQEFFFLNDLNPRVRKGRSMESISFSCFEADLEPDSQFHLHVKLE
jgi:hypothetical protein